MRTIKATRKILNIEPNKTAFILVIHITYVSSFMVQSVTKPTVQKQLFRAGQREF
ncbi:hypothetical protein AF72_09975 [Xylella taiwanensis]|uniref:Uncharacterized protein n=1 Tax=Xylella taiwanensis TaxID=1444770 RepID=Z9JGU5_9GAMM|nr:hypothetical protein AF72_09975 [Xylella taiwanensis]